MFSPNTTGILKRRLGYNKFGEPLWSAPETVPCAVVHLQVKTQKTSVRTDSSATRGNAEEVASTARILFPIGVFVEKDHKFTIRGNELRVVSVEPRFAVSGRHDHDQAELTVWIGDPAP